MHPTIGYDVEHPFIIFRTITRTLYDWHLTRVLERRSKGVQGASSRERWMRLPCLVFAGDIRYD